MATSNDLIFDAFHNGFFVDSALKIINTIIEAGTSLDVNELLELTELTQSKFSSSLYILLEFSCIKKVKKVEVISHSVKCTMTYQISNRFEEFINDK